MYILLFLINATVIVLFNVDLLFKYVFHFPLNKIRWALCVRSACLRWWYSVFCPALCALGFKSTKSMYDFHHHHHHHHQHHCTLGCWFSLVSQTLKLKVWHSQTLWWRSRMCRKHVWMSYFSHLASENWTSAMSGFFFFLFQLYQGCEWFHHFPHLVICVVSESRRWNEAAKNKEKSCDGAGWLQRMHWKPFAKTSPKHNVFAAAESLQITGGIPNLTS